MAIQRPSFLGATRQYDPASSSFTVALWSCRAPLIAAAAVICLLNGLSLLRLLTASAPRNPWEATEIVEAWRSLEGMPVYELGQDGHATHMYGALVPWLQGEIFRWTGPNNISGRALSLASALVMVSIITFCMKKGRSLWYLMITWAAIFGVNHRSGHYFAENRPDLPALLFATLAIIFFWCGQNRSRAYAVLGSACLITGFFLKQTVAIFALVPLFVLFLGKRRPTRGEVLVAVLPLAAMTATVVALKAMSPVLYHYMVEVPGGYGINWPRVIKFSWELLLDSPLFVFLLGEWFLFDQTSLDEDTRIPWLIAVLAVAVPSSSLAQAKVGGYSNSMLPAFLAMMAFCALRLPRLLAHLENLASPLRSRLAYATFLSLLLLMTIFPHITVANGPMVLASPWDRDYEKVVVLARALPGKVICPEDPSIPLHAKGYAGLNIFAEKDARPSRGDWPKATPEPVLAELRTAEFVVDVANYFGDNLEPSLLEKSGFVLAREFSLNAGCYAIWRRRDSERNDSHDQTALLETMKLTTDQPVR
jgi:hypothetical protein